MRRFADVQGLRAIAVLAVVLFHAGLPMPGGFVGVDIFFVISGFVIAHMLIREREKTGRTDLRRFYVRRFKRLTPALAVVVAFSVVGATLLLSPLGSMQNAALTGIGALLLCANYVIAATTGEYFDPAASINPLLHTWSLAVEEQFYLVFPMILLLGWWLASRRGAPRWIPTAILVVTALVSVYLCFSAVFADPIGRIPPVFDGVTGRVPTFIVGTFFGFYGPLGRVWEFIVGALVAFALTRIQNLPRPAAGLLGVLGAAGVLGSLWLIDEGDAFPGPWTALPVISTVLLISAGRAGTNMVSRVLASRPAVWIGDRSYSWYLWHWPLIVFADLLTAQDAWARLVALGLSLVAAMASYRWVENPLRNMPSRPLRRFLPLAAAILVVPLVVSGGSYVSGRAGSFNDGVRAYQAANAPHLGGASGCDTARPALMREENSCTWNGGATGARIYLVGDSNADHFSEAVLGAAEALGAPMELSTSNACPLFDGHFRWDDASNDWNVTCERYRSGTVEYLTQEASPGTVVVAQVGRYWSSPTVSAGTSAQEASFETAAKLLALEDTLDGLIESLRSAGHQVLIVQQVPFYNDEEYQPQLCSAFAMASLDCVGEISRATAEDQFPEVQRIYEEIAIRPGTATLQLRDDLCGPQSCSTFADGVIQYRDGLHISVQASEGLSHRFRDAIAALRSGTS